MEILGVTFLVLEIVLLTILYLTVGGIIYVLTSDTDDVHSYSAKLSFMLFWPIMFILWLGWLFTELCFFISGKIVGLFKHNSKEN